MATQTINPSQRQIEALKLKAKGYDLNTISEKLSAQYSLSNYTRAHVSIDINNEMSKVQEENIGTIRKLRALEILRLEFYLQSLEAKIESGDMFAISLALNISGKICQLEGLNAPTEVRVKELVSQTIVDEYNALFERLESDESISEATRERIYRHAVSISDRVSVATEN